MHAPPPPVATETASTLDAWAAALSESRPALSPEAPRQRWEVPVLSLREEGARYWVLELEPPAAAETRLERAAQYITLGLASLAPRYLALASSPHESTWQFLIDRASTLGVALAAAGGHLDTVSVSAPEGRGWTLDELVSGTPLLAITTGSGIATMRAALAMLANARPDALSGVQLYYGELYAADAAYREEREAWQALGAQVFLAAERDHPQGWRHVQHPLDVHVPAELSSARALLSGASVMIRYVSVALAQRGMARDAVLLNI